MKIRWEASFVLLALAAGSAQGQMSGAAPEPITAPSGTSADAAESATPAPARTAQTFAAKPRAGVRTPPMKPASLTPLSRRERVVQLLDRFTFGPRPGEVDRVLAQGADKWLEQQFNPASIKDGGLDRRLGDYPTLAMSPQDALGVFPDRQQVYAVADGKVPYPTDPLQNAVFEVQVYKWNLERDQKKADGSGQPRAPLSDTEVAAQKKAGQATAARIAGDLFSLPKNQRMAAFIKLPVAERVAFTTNGNLTGDQRNLLFADSTPREREVFQAMAAHIGTAGGMANELAEAHLLRDVLSERQLQAVMTDFWFNHFNIFIAKDGDLWYTTSYERDVIRKNALGNFHDLLLATAQSPAMMVYLDNYLSIGPDSQANNGNPKNPRGKRGSKGLNENYGREVMELHTVGVGGGYSQADVTALSSILTGWGVDRANQGGPFVFDPRRHEPGTKTWFGYQIADDGTVLGKDAQTAATEPAGTAPATNASVNQGITALNILAESPQTAHFISTLLAQYFVADDPPPALVDRLTKTYLSSKGDIKTILRALITSPEFNSRQYFHNKVKTPEEFVASAFRATATDPQNPGALTNTVKTMGMQLYYALPPTGYYLTADKWMNSAALVDRLNFAYALTNGKFANQKFDAPRLLAMGLLTGDGRTTPPAAAVTAKPVNSTTAANFRLMSSTTSSPAEAAEARPASATGAQLAMRVLEATMIGVSVSAQTNLLINKQLAEQPAGASATDTLNLLTALVMGSPEFQLR